LKQDFGKAQASFFLIHDDQQKDMMYDVNLLESQLRNWKGNISCGCRMIKPFFVVNDDVVTTDWTQRKRSWAVTETT